MSDYEPKLTLKNFAITNFVLKCYSHCAIINYFSNFAITNFVLKLIHGSRVRIYFRFCYNKFCIEICQIIINEIKVSKFCYNKFCIEIAD